MTNSADGAETTSPSREERWLTVNAAATCASVTRRTIYNWMSKGRLTVRATAGGKLRILESSLFRPYDPGDTPVD